MTIKHRIFVRSYRRKISKINKPKYNYKKFTGITTLALNKSEAKSLPKKIKNYKITKPKGKLFFLKPYILKKLSASALKEEYAFASRDIKTFMDYAIPTGAQNVKVVKDFKAFLPKDIWNKLSTGEKQAHLRKRRELQAKGLVIQDRHQGRRNKVAKNIVKFSARSLRPLLTSLEVSDRRSYLKSLAQKAKFLADKSYEDKNKDMRILLPRARLIRQELVRHQVTALKKSLKFLVAKKITNKQKLSNITYVSILPTIRALNKNVN